MARGPSVLEDDGPVSSTGDSTSDTSNTGLLHRRSYLKLAGVAAAASTGAAAVGAVAAEEYEVIELDPGERRVIRVGSGETFENTLIDQTARGSGAVITARGTNWTIRNVGFRGPFSPDDAGMGLADTGGGTSTVENVYMGDGTVSPRQRRYPSWGIWVAPDHNGHLEFDGVHIADANDNAFYASAPGSNGNGRLGTVHFRNCYARDSWISGFRLSRGRVENCVAVNTGSGRDGRPLWVWPTDRHDDEVEVVDCHFIAGSYPYSAVLGHGPEAGRATDVYLENVQTSGPINEASNALAVRDGGENGSDARDFVPDGCPESAEAAASGASRSDTASAGQVAEADPEESDDELEHVLLFDGSEDAVTRYEFVVDGEVEPSTDEGASIDASTELEDGHARGVVANWKDAFRFSGDLEELTVDGPATVTLDGEAIDPDEYGESHPHVLEVDGRGSPSSFEVTVDGDLEVADGTPADDVTIVSGTTAEGSVDEGSRTFRFSGAVVDLTVRGDARVLVDGEEVDPDAYGEELLSHALLIDGTEASGPSTYSFRVDGRVARPTFSGPSADEDVIEGRAVRGVVSDWLEVYWFDGELTDCTVLGDAAVSIQYNARSQ